MRSGSGCCCRAGFFATLAVRFPAPLAPALEEPLCAPFFAAEPFFDPALPELLVLAEPFEAAFEFDLPDDFAADLDCFFVPDCAAFTFALADLATRASAAHASG